MFRFHNKNVVQWTAALLVVLSLVLSGCAPQTTPTSAPVAPETQAPPTEAPTEPPTAAPTEEPTAAPVEMHISWWGSQARHDATIKVIEMFMAEHPNITITYDFASFPDYWPLLTTKAAGGNLSCVMQQDYAYYRQYIKDGLLLPLDPYVEDGTIDLSNVSEDAISGGKLDGKLYALSLGTNSQAFAIDADMFAEAGVEIPSPDWTWKDFEEVNLALHEKLGHYGNGGIIDLPTVTPILVNATYLSLGMDGLYANDGAALGFTDTQPLKDLFSMMVRLQDAKATVSHADQLATPPTPQDNAFVKGEAAMYLAHTNQVVAVWTAAGEDRNIQLVPMPRAEGATRSANYFKPSMFFSISSHCKTPKEAAMFIDYFTNSVEANQVLMAERGVPISSAVAEALKPTLTKAQAASFDFLAALEGNVSPIPQPDPAANNDIVTNVLGPLVLDPMLLGEITPEEAAELYFTEANKLLAP